MSHIIEISIEQLRGLIGVRLYYRKQLYQVIEVLEDGPSIVIQHLQELSIQHNQHGEAQRKAPLTCTIPVLSADKKSIHPDFLSLDLE